MLTRPWTTPRPILIVELAIVAAAYLLYSLIRNAAPEREALAIYNGLQVWQLEQTLMLDIVPWLNHTINDITWLIVGMNYFYAIMHFVVTAGVLIWLYWHHPGRYRAARTTLACTTGLALLGYYLYPLAPPRLLPGADFIDTVRVHETWGSLASGDLKAVSNQFAAMPSMHAGWSLWCGIMLILFAHARWVKTLGAIYPLATLIVITATANHFVLDAIGGWLTLAAGFALQWAIYRRPAHTFPQHAISTT
ncbi:phosphatase PAP2 family protein [Actinobacteria bacterium YIM 96077]|uniref:PAP2 family protein n=1 Tax=Phytoactinopolyspora halophila TaxID=1981511 RepID=A0A329QZ96_9ACTN|nr:phosphatase PAP2 family protein [Phytoactinopolyspora halophila]AYY13115.1 phosphatase PAP2 family protein [Actinobacteria bacterium YIM 96077]RAW17645.1 PAP2 family protein [Phytoactinopolyspora halophila]